VFALAGLDLGDGAQGLGDAQRAGHQKHGRQGSGGKSRIFRKTIDLMIPAKAHAEGPQVRVSVQSGARL
jgi:hypothetical protein